MKFKTTALWRRALGDQAPADHSAARQRLAAAYDAFWRHGIVLAEQIARDLPNLTLHDEHHFEALWQRADRIAGPEYLLNPLELFVFGGSILLHDAAHTLKAYPGGLTELEDAPEWKDSLAAILEARAFTSRESLSPEDRQAIIFETLRALHAQRAETLPEMAFVNDQTDQRIYLIDDSYLRYHLGNTIGSVAASHHWNLNDLEIRLRKKLGGLAEFPPEWTIEPIKLACLLRCADATQIDQARAPDFSYALLRLRGLSEAHWRGQNRLGTPTVDSNTPEALLFTSTKPFDSRDADAWWIAYDAISLANRELQGSARLLNDLGFAPFTINRIQDSDSPERLSKHIEVRGWRPVAAEVRAGRVENLVAMFGGHQLYGNDLAVPVRELIQNSDDAIRARTELEPGRFAGRITVRLVSELDRGGNGYWLHIEDNGLGMSERRLTDALLEFGTSYWHSDLIRSEFPGLRGKRLRQTGRYGIGFFSVLMASDRIVVASRSYDEGNANTRSLVFREGLKLRPLLLEGADPPLPMDVCTRVSVFLPSDKSKALLRASGDFHDDSPHRDITLEQLIGHLCAGLESDVQVEGPKGELVSAHRANWRSNNLAEWLRQITMEDVWAEDQTQYLEKHVPLLRPIAHGKDSLGFASIATSPVKAGIRVIGGLATGHHARSRNLWSDQFIGVMEVLPEGPRRFGGKPAASQEELATWASEQAELIKSSKMSLSELYYASMAVAQFGGDPTPIAMMPLNRQLENIDLIFDTLKSKKIVAPLEESDDMLYLSPLRLRTGPYSQTSLGINEIEPIGDLMEALMPRLHIPGHEKYFEAPSSTNLAPNSFLGCLQRHCRARQEELVLEIGNDTIFGKYTGASSERERIQTGMELRGQGVTLSLRR